MTEASQQTHPLPYAGPSTRTPSTKRFVVLVVVNALAAVASLYFVPLAAHIWSCTQSEKWCHVAAFVLGVPSAFVWVVLFVVTASVTVAPQSTQGRSKSLRIAAWLLLLFVAFVLAALFVAVVHNSK